jgi:hypothetical protein
MRLRTLGRSVDSVGVDPVDSVGLDPVDSVGLDRVSHFASSHPKRPSSTNPHFEVCTSHILNLGAHAPPSVDSVGVDPVDSVVGHLVSGLPEVWAPHIVNFGAVLPSLAWSCIVIWTQCSAVCAHPMGNHFPSPGPLVYTIHLQCDRIQVAIQRSPIQFLL